MSPDEEAAWYERVIADRQARRQHVLDEVIANHTERRARTAFYQVADRATGPTFPEEATP